jgi:hypothetical protein
MSRADQTRRAHNTDDTVEGHLGDEHSGRMIGDAADLHIRRRVG